MTPSTGTLGRLQAAAWAALLSLCVGAVVHAVAFSDDVPFVTPDAAGAWITAPIVPTANLIVVRPEAPPTLTFVKRFDARADLKQARLRGRALRRVEIQLNGERVDVAADGVGWKNAFEIDLAPLLRDGRNELRASVQNVHGPALLQLSFRIGDRLIETDEHWQVVTNHQNPVAAVLARDTSIHPESRLLAPSGQVALDRAPILLALFIGASLTAWLIATRLPARRQARAAEGALCVITLFWLLVYLTKATRMPVALGFDAHAHLAYIDYLIQHLAPPTAAYGFSTYHPPVFHALTAALVALFGVTPETSAGPAVYRILPMLSGLSTVWLTFAFARRLWPGEALRPTLAVSVAGLLPMNIYMATYVSNEALHATWVSLALVLTMSLLLAPRFSIRRAGALGIVLGLALLTKFTSLVLAPLIAAFAAARVWLIDDRGPVRAAFVGASVLMLAGVIAGWFYLRNWMLFGDPVVWNLDVPGAATWWMLPGFHTSDAYLRFGESLVYPFFSGFASFWDGVYSTLWGDGLVAGMIRIATRHPFWRYDFMTLIYPLALPATALFVLGFFRLLAESFREPTVGRRLVLSMTTSLLFILSFSLFFITLRLPFYAQAKAPYTLAAALPLALCAAEGLAWLPRRFDGIRTRPLIALYFGWLGTLGGSIALAFLG